jgi:hypothetical protein
LESKLKKFVLIVAALLSVGGAARAGSMSHDDLAKALQASPDAARDLGTCTFTAEAPIFAAHLDPKSQAAIAPVIRECMHRSGYPNY